MDPIVLSHPDFNIQNCIVFTVGELKRIIDWTGVYAVLRSFSSKSYPMWLVRDWFPVIYVYDESMDQGMEPESVLEDSPASLRY